MATGNQKASKWAIVINAKKETPEEAVVAELQGLVSSLINSIPNKYHFAIIHDKDKEDDRHKRTHLHLVLELPVKQTKAVVLASLCRGAGIDSDQISLDPANSPFLAEQYLIHKNDPTKASYDAEQIITNDKSELLKRLSMEYLTPEERAQRDMQALMTVNSFAELVNVTGLDFAHKYRTSFNELRTEREQDYDGLNKKINHFIYLLNRGAKILSDILPLLTIDNDKQSQVLKERIESYLEDLKGRI